MAALTVTPNDRLSFTLFLAASLHAALILGIGFTAGLEVAASPTIEVTLAQFSDPDAPETADFIAQSNQIGSGTESEIVEMTVQQETDFSDSQLNQVLSAPPPVPRATRLERRELLTTLSNPDDAAPTRDETPVDEQLPELTLQNRSYDELAREIASLEARIAEEQRALAREPRVKRLTSVSTRSADEAAYLNMWRQKVERVGNANYPAGNIFGDLRMLVVLNFDGRVEDLRILKSSGHKALDEAALRIVRLASPFQDFPVEMRKQYDQLEIIRTWRFTRSGTSLDS
ncbi:MAG: energy transducer TonB [Pseudomonadales bacterium]|nr:energy transducer TonB [Pseudomonadales bacterium]